MSSIKPTVLVYTQDLFFGVRIQDVIERYGGQMKQVGTAADLADGLGEVPVLAIVELGPGGGGDWIDAVNYARKWTRGIPIVAFGSHVDTDAREAARQAGCDTVWSKSHFSKELPALVQRYLNPQETTPGCDELPNDLVQEGLRLFNEGQYYKCHDALEEAWVADRRPCRDLYQGILQLAVSLHHIEQDKYTGADKMMRRAINKFQRLPEACQGFDVTLLLETSRSLLALLHETGPTGLEAFPREQFPTITYRSVVNSADT